MKDQLYELPTVGSVYTTLKSPTITRTWSLYPCKSTYFRLDLPDAPNWFHRKMQGLLLGFRYERIKNANANK